MQHWNLGPGGLLGRRLYGLIFLSIYCSKMDEIQCMDFLHAQITTFCDLSALNEKCSLLCAVCSCLLATWSFTPESKKTSRVKGHVRSMFGACLVRVMHYCPLASKPIASWTQRKKQVEKSTACYLKQPLDRNSDLFCWVGWRNKGCKRDWRWLKYQ